MIINFIANICNKYIIHLIFIWIPEIIGFRFMKRVDWNVINGTSVIYWTRHFGRRDLQRLNSFIEEI